MIGIIVALNADRIIGVNGSIPWKYSADMKRFKAVTMGSTVIMGRKTWESIPAKFRPLAGRDNVVISSTFGYGRLGHDDVAGCYYARSVRSALTELPRWFVPLDMNEHTWFIGGARIYAEAMQYADVIDVTWVPWETEYTSHEVAVYADDDGGVQEYASNDSNELTYFPPIDESIFAPGERTPHPDDPQLQLQRYTRR